MQRSASPFRAPSPFNPHQISNNQYTAYPTQLPTGVAQVGPGATTYTTSIGPDGRPIYTPYKAVAASYHTPNGIVSGIQWIPQEATLTMPPGPPQEPNKLHGSSYTPSSGSYKDDHKGATDRLRSDDKRRNDEKRAYEEGGKGDPEYELLLARERDAKATAERNRRPSFHAAGTATAAPIGFPAAGVAKSDYTPYPPAYPPQPYPNYGVMNPPLVPAPYPPGAFGYGHTRSASGSVHEISKQFKDMDLERNRDREQAERTGKTSGVSGSHGRSLSTTGETYGRPRALSGNFGDRPNPYPSPPNSYTPSASYTSAIPPTNYAPYPASSYIAPSPNVRPQDMSFGAANATGYPTASSNYTTSSVRSGSTEMSQRSTTPHGPPPSNSYSHSYGSEAPQPNFSSKPRSRAPSRAPSPNPGAYFGPSNPSSAPQIGKSPRARAGSIHASAQPQQLPAPEAFSRPINGSNAFTPFDMMKIQNMDEIYDPKLPKMPGVLTTHDIYPEDWKRCMQDLGRSWTGQLPVPTLGQDGRPPKRSTLTADLIDLWNASFFLTRGVELILYKGRERRTGPQAGHIDNRLSQYDETDDSSSSSSSSDSDDSDYVHKMTDAYGRPIGGQVGMAELQEARRRRQERKQEKKRRRKEKKARRKAKARDKTYSVYLACTPQGPPIPFVGRPPTGPVGYNPSQAVPTAGYVPSSYGAPAGIPTTRSHGYGGGY